MWNNININREINIMYMNMFINMNYRYGRSPSLFDFSMDLVSFGIFLPEHIYCLVGAVVSELYRLLGQSPFRGCYRICKEEERNKNKRRISYYNK